MCGSAMWARVMPTMSTCPASMACRAVLRSVMRVAWKTGRPVARRISAAPGEEGAGALAHGGDQLGDAEVGRGVRATR